MAAATQQPIPSAARLALAPEELAELRARLEYREKYEAASESERAHLNRKSRLETSFASFFHEAWKVLEPGTELTPSWHYELIAEYLTLVARGQLRRLIINVPPRTAKSTLGTICFPAWLWALSPTKRILTASYSADLSRDHSVKRRDLIRSDWFTSLWSMTLADDTDRQGQYKNTAQGEMIATSVGASGTGRGGNLLILDDGLSAMDADSPAKRKATHEWFKKTWRSRMNDPAKDAMIVIEQRTHQEDVTGWLLANEPGQWTHLCIPMEAEETERWVFPISGRVVTRERGEILPRFTAESVAGWKVHSRTWSTQYQQKPAPDGGVICNREWWQLYRAIPASFDSVIDSWDFAFKKTSDSDLVAGFKVGAKGANKYFLNAIWDRMGFVASRDACARLARMQPQASRVLVEDKANGSAIIDSLKASIPGIIPVEPQGSKESRWWAASADIEAKNVWLPDPKVFPEHAWWVDKLIEEWAILPNGSNDDGADGSAQAINFLRNARSGFDEFYERKAQEQVGSQLAQIEAAKVKPADRRAWSESIRILAMGVVPETAPDGAELADYIAFCESNGNQVQAAMARAQLEKQEKL